MKTLYKIFLTALGAGYSPVAPGTCGAILACVVLWLLTINGINLTTTQFGILIFVAGILLITLLGIVATNALEEEWGKDPSKVVIDEVVGMWVTMLFVPVTWLTLLIGFVLFRFFDIAKPLGIRKMENLGGGLGVMADDILAGIYANISLLIINWTLTMI